MKKNDSNVSMEEAATYAGRERWSMLTGNTLFYTLLITVGYYVLIGIFSPSFILPSNIALVVQHSAPLIIVAVGELGTLAIKQMDLSVGGIVGLSGVLVSLMINSGANLEISVLTVLGVGIGIGAINAFLVNAGVNSFISTFGVFEVLEGLALVITKGWPITVTLPSFGFIANANVAGLRLQSIYAILIALIGGLIYAKFRIGRYIYAVGSNKEAAEIGGVSVKKVTYLVFIISGLLSSFSGIVSASFLSVGQVSTGSGYALPAIAACVLGGASLFGGKGNPAGAFVGAFLISSITDGLVMSNASPYWEDVVIGLILLFAVSVDAIRRRRFY